MKSKVKAVVDLMNTLGVSLEDVAAVMNRTLAPPPQTKQTSVSSTGNQIAWGQTRNGMHYMEYNGEIIGLCLTLAMGEKFILAKAESRRNMDIRAARDYADNMLMPINGKKWEVPYDEHFRAIQSIGVNTVNNALREIGGDVMDSAYLSATSQHNRPSSWGVRFVLPLPL